MSTKVAVQKLIQYLRIKTVHPTPDYAGAIQFLKNYAAEIGVDSCKEIEVGPNRNVLVMSLYGQSKDEQSILLNSHTDVVPVETSFWKCDPFEGKRYENGDIYGRGVQDMKTVGIQHLEVIRKLKLNKIQPKRTIHVSFVPDEEIGGVHGFGAFINTQDFKDLKVGIALDEGLASPTDEFTVFYGERVAWWLNIHFSGNTGHGSRFIEKTAAEKLLKFLNRVLMYRQEEKHKLESNCNCMKLGDVTTVNVTGLEGGLAANIVPPSFKATFDFRIDPKQDLKKFEQKLQEWIKEAEGDDTGKITYEFIGGRNDIFNLSSTDPEKNKWWKSFNNSISELGLKVTPEVFPAATDARYIRKLGIPAFGFTPLNNTPILLHDHNEFVNEEIFLKGIDILYKIVLDLANL